MMEAIGDFSRLHANYTLCDFKEAWARWTCNNIAMIERETLRLRNMGYDGDVLAKMYVSSRYYYRNKKITEKTVERVVEHRDYLACSDKFLAKINSHVQDFCIYYSKSPSVGYSHFCELHSKLLVQEITFISKHSNLEHQAIVEKLKKTYKNRYNVLATLTQN